MTKAPPKQDSFFQGTDWHSSRATVAQAFDTLDRLQGNCLCQMQDPRNPDVSTAQEACETLLSLVDDLGADVDTALADILGKTQRHPFAQEWMGFEIRLLISQSRAFLYTEEPVSPSFFETLFILFSKTKETLRAIDSPEGDTSAGGGPLA